MQMEIEIVEDESGTAPQVPEQLLLKMTFTHPKMRFFKRVGTPAEAWEVLYGLAIGTIAPREESVEEFTQRGGLVAKCPTRFAEGASHAQNRKVIDAPMAKQAMSRRELAALTLDDLFGEPVEKKSSPVLSQSPANGDLLQAFYQDLVVVKRESGI